MCGHRFRNLNWTLVGSQLKAMTELPSEFTSLIFFCGGGGVILLSLRALEMFCPQSETTSHGKLLKYKWINLGERLKAGMWGKSGLYVPWFPSTTQNYLQSESRLRNCLNQISLWAGLWESVLIHVGRSGPLWGVLCLGRWFWIL